MIGRIQDSETAVDTRFPGESGAVAGRVPVVAEIHNCGCVTSHTTAGYLAEAVFCPEALPIERERLVLRRVQRQRELEDPRLDELIPALEEREAALEAHRRSTGIAETVARMSYPDLLPGEVPVAAPANPAAQRATKKGGPS